MRYYGALAPLPCDFACSRLWWFAARVLAHRGRYVHLSLAGHLLTGAVAGKRAASACVFVARTSGAPE